MSHTEEPFSCARFRARLFFRGTISLRLTAISERYWAFPCLTALRPDLMMDSSGSWWVWDTICSTRGDVTWIEEAYSRAASWHGLLKPRPPRRTGSARTSLSKVLHLRSTIARIRTWEIASSSGSKRSCISGSVLKKNMSNGVLNQTCRRRSWPVVEPVQIQQVEQLH